MSKRMSKAAVRRFFEYLQAADPEPVTELNYSNEFELLAAVMLSAQSTDVGVNKATAKLYPVANTPQAILDLGEAELKRYISTLGLYNSKARHLIGACEILVSRHGGEVPRTRRELEALPGIGVVTAAQIIQCRNEAGDFISIEDLTRVKGIGRKKAQLLQGHLTF